MYEKLKDRIAELLRHPRPIKPQTERQLARHLTESSTDTVTFLLEAAQQLEEYELDILYAPQFTPEMQDQADVSDLLYHWRPDAGELDRLAPELCAQVKHGVVQLAGGRVVGGDVSWFTSFGTRYNRTVAPRSEINIPGTRGGTIRFKLINASSCESVSLGGFLPR